MKRNTFNNPKVRFELREGGPPEEEGRQLVLFKDAYQEGARLLKTMWYNGVGMFDINIPCVAPGRKFTMPEEGKIQALVEDPHK